MNTSPNFLKIGCTKDTRYFFTNSNRQIEFIDQTSDFCAISIAVLKNTDKEIITKIKETGFGIPIIFVNDPITTKSHLNEQIDKLAENYENSLISPFLKGLIIHNDKEALHFDTPGHHDGAFFNRHPTGTIFKNFIGEECFRNDRSASDTDMGDLLIHQGYPELAEKNCAKVFNADTAYFVFNGSSTSNLIVCKALLAKNDLVLFDRNNHKSVYNGALIQSGAIPVYLQTERNDYGFIGGISAFCLNESFILNKVKEVKKNFDEKNLNNEKLFRLAIIQLETYDGTIYNAKQIINKIGNLCDYILFDSAWLGYEQFIPMISDCSPLSIDLTEKDPGIIVIHSVHKQMAGFSQASQILKKDSHIKNQKRYCNDKIFNSAYRFYTSTSPFYPLFASIDVNAKIHEGPAGINLWRNAVIIAIEARKRVIKECKYIKPFVPENVNGQNWEDINTNVIYSNIECFKMYPNELWHGYENYEKNQYIIDPCKLLFKTVGININTKEYEDFGIPAKILSYYLEEKFVICEKADFNSILFLITPGECMSKLNALIDYFVMFEKIIDDNVLIKDCLPNLYLQFENRYKDYSLKQLCQEMHNFYKVNNLKLYQKRMFLYDYMPEIAINANKADYEFVKNHGELVNINDIKGKIAMEGALPYPPGIYVIVPGERWSETAQKYFMILIEGINKFPGFCPELQGIYLEKNEKTGKIEGFGYVLNEKDYPLNSDDKE